MTLQIDAPSLLPLESRPIAPDSDGITLGQIFGTLWRRRAILLATIFSITAIGFVILKLLTPTFTSTAIIILSTRQDAIVDMEQSYLQTQTADAVVRSEADTLQSRTLINRVIDRENLMDDPEFNVYAQPFKPNLMTRLGIADHLPRFLQSYIRNKPLDPGLLTPAQLKYNVATQVLKSYDVAPDAKTYTVKISFTSVDAEKASRIANAFAEEYMKSQVDERLAAADRAADWINAHLADLSKKV